MRVITFTPDLVTALPVGRYVISCHPLLPRFVSPRKPNPADVNRRDLAIFELVPIHVTLLQLCERVADAELRVDPSDGNQYSRQDFIDAYGGTAEWDAAAR